METDFFASMLVPPFHPSPEWAEALAEHLLHPHFPITFLEAIGRRLRRNYLYIYAIIGVAWLFKLGLYPESATSWQTIIGRAQIGELNGFWVFSVVILFYLGIIILSVATASMHQTAGEVLPRYGSLTESSISKEPSKDRDAWFRPAHRRKQLLTIIVTDHAQELSGQILQEMNRGVTSLTGTGMYTRESHGVLLCALTVTEIPQLKAITQSIDPNAFVIVSPAQEVFGRGFQPLNN